MDKNQLSALFSCLRNDSNSKFIFGNGAVLYYAYSDYFVLIFGGYHVFLFEDEMIEKILDGAFL